MPSPPPIDEPLTLTVHNLPQLDRSSASVIAATRSGRWKMLLLLLVTAAPVVASYFTYYVIRPQGGRNYGELIDPQRPLPGWTGVNSQGQPQPLSQLKDQWLLISVADSACDTACQNHLLLQRQLRETLGREKDRLDWVWLRTGAADLSPALKAATADADVLHVDANQLASWLAPAAGHELKNHLYLVDPVGNWMMRFPPNLDIKTAPQVKRDIDRLLRASAFWDKKGRP